MKTVSKKLLSLLLVAILLVSALPFQAFADGCAHTNVEKDLTTKREPTCYTDGQKADKVCVDCGAVVEPGQVLPATGAHVFGSDGKCTTPGCTAVCPHSSTVISGAKDATCVAEGYTGNTVCSTCGATVSTGTVIPATGAHTYGVDHKCTVCGAPDSSKESHIGTHYPWAWEYNDTTHWLICNDDACLSEGQPLYTNAHTFDANGVCETCKYACDHSKFGTVEKASTAKVADCIHPGKAADQFCSNCGARVKEGDVIPATGLHSYNENGICTVEGCGAVQTGGSFELTLDAKGGTINGLDKATVAVKQNSPIGTLPVPTRQGYTFAGWYVGDTLINFGQIYKFGQDVTAEAKWTEITYQLTVRRVLNGDNSTAKTIHTVNVPAGTPLLGYLNTNIASIVRSELALTPGYAWEYNYWRDYSGTQPLTDQTACMNQAQTVFVNFVSKSYTLYFNANGGAVTPLSKTVYFGSPVGTLPTASLDGKVFRGWRDVNGTLYNANTVYQVAGDTSLTAVWEDEALVILYIYVNGDFSSCNRMILMDQYVKNDNISRADVYAQVVKYYTPASGTLSIAGLFDEYTWSSYRANTSKAGTENIEIDASHPNKIYVMVNNANTGTIISGGGGSTIPTIPSNTTPAGAYWVDLGNGNGYWVYPAPSTPNSTYPTYIIIGSNPKTGDTAKIEIAAAVMVLTAAALITVMALRKKKSV